jgi:hypothetical protein
MDEVPRSVRLAGNRVLVGLPSLALCALETAKGRLDWCTFQLRVPMVGLPLVDDRHVYAALLDGTLRTLERGSGTLVRSEQLKGRPGAGPSPLGSNIVVPLLSNEFVIVTPAGQMSRVPAPSTARLFAAVGIASDARLLAGLSATLTEDMTLSLLEPAPSPAVPALPANLGLPGGLVRGHPVILHPRP